MRRINSIIAKNIAWLALVMVLMVVTIVVMRYAFGMNYIWQSELVQALHAAMFLLMAGYALERDRHVRVDVFYERFCAAKRAKINRIGMIFLLVPVCGMLLYTSSAFVINSWKILEGSREYGGLGGVFVIKTLIPLYAILLIVGAAVVLRRGDTKNLGH